MQVRREGGGGVRRVRPGAHPRTPAPPPPPSHQRSTFLLISDLKQREVGVLFYSNLLWLCSKIENAVKEVTSLTHPFHKTCFSLHKV